MNEQKFPPARILGIESSCDETAASVADDGRMVLSNVVASQEEIHAKYGGVFPEVASRQHIKTVYTVVEEALAQAHVGLDDIDAIAVTRGPGLAGSLVVGLNMAKGMALGSGKPIVGVNHLEGHLYSAWIDPADSIDEQEAPPEFPVLALIVSGGHTELILIRDHLQYERLGGTLDDAAGEAFDKVARLLDIGYPGGPAVQLTANGGDINAFRFPRAMMKGTWDFSFSGVKTSVLTKVRELRAELGESENDEDVDLPLKDLAASFQQAVVDVLVNKTRSAAQEFQAKEIVVAGGVSANELLREKITVGAPGRVHIPPLKYCTDNAAMIAAAGYYRFIHGHVSDLAMDAMPTWPLTEI